MASLASLVYCLFDKAEAYWRGKYYTRLQELAKGKTLAYFPEH
jgi:hypothetical protein